MSGATEGDIALACASLLVDELVRSGGMEHACLAPGSRSTPMALALARHAAVTTHVHVDERSSAFVALGIAKASGRPAAVLCTSGTAAANHFPAVIEASLARVPLIVLTADRPPELHGVGANQTIDQQHLYGSFVKHFEDAGVPAADTDAAARWRELGRRALRVALGQPAGPVHINLPFREPLVPTGSDVPLVDDAPTADAATRAIAPVPTDTDIEALARELQATETGVVVAGAASAPVIGLGDLTARLAWPLIAEPISGARLPGVATEAGSLLVSDAAWREAHQPGIVLQVGAAPTTRSVQALLREAKHLLIVDPDSLNPDPERRAERRLQCDASALVAAVARRVTARTPPTWSQEWNEAGSAARRAVDLLLDSWDEPFEGRVARDLAAWIPEDGVLFVGSSMPVRDVDYFMTGRTGIRVMANRGASGIDGSVSTVMGIAGTGVPTYALLGDLAMLHDLSGFTWNARSERGPLIVVIDNDGGGIFSLLPQATTLQPPEFERYFGTPHGLDLAAIGRAAGAHLATVDRAGELIPALESLDHLPGLRMVTVRVDRRRAGDLREQVASAVHQALSGS